MSLRIYFDGECPFCSQYVRLLRLRDSFGEPTLVDLRIDHEARSRFASAGIKLDQGMVIEVDQQQYVGEEAIHVLATLSTQSDLANRINHCVFSSRSLARLVYPLLRAGRNATLFALGRTQLDREQGRPPDLLVVFNLVWGLFALVHAISYAFFFNTPVFPSTVATGIFGFMLLRRPGSIRLFALVIGSLAIDAWLQMPLGSNHTIIKNFLLAAMLSSAVWQWLRGGSIVDFYQGFVPAGRVLLILMYVFGIFHKINRDFLDPAVSCAVALWREMPAPLSYIDNQAMHSLAIYGTFLAEGAILLFLMHRKTHLVGIATGIAFHSLLALSSFAMYAQFSTLTVALHLLFLTSDDAKAICGSAFWKRMTAWIESTRGGIAIALWTLLIAALAWNGSYSQLSVVWLPTMLGVAWLVFRKGKSGSARNEEHRFLWSRNMAANVISALFLLNCAAPYLGLKSAQSINMFANLRLEGGVSNHLLLSAAPGPFDHLEDVVTVVESSGSGLLDYVRLQDLRLTRYHLLDHLDRHPAATATFDSDGTRHVNQSAMTLANEIATTLHPRWVRNWLHFNPVDLSEPKPCALDR